jgi:hypothetical protein
MSADYYYPELCEGGDDYDEDDYYGRGEDCSQLNLVLSMIIVVLLILGIYMYINRNAGKCPPAPAPTPTPTPTPNPAFHKTGGHNEHLLNKKEHEHLLPKGDRRGQRKFTGSVPPTEHMSSPSKSKAQYSPGVDKIRGPSKQREFADCGSEMSDLAGYTN